MRLFWVGFIMGVLIGLSAAATFYNLVTYD